MDVQLGDRAQSSSYALSKCRVIGARKSKQGKVARHAGLSGAYQHKVGAVEVCGKECHVFFSGALDTTSKMVEGGKPHRGKANILNVVMADSIMERRALGKCTVCRACQGARK